MMRSAAPIRARWGLTALAIPLLVVLGQSASPVFWRVSTQADFLRGEVDDVSVDTIGRILLGPKMDMLYETTVPFLWSADEANGRLWVGSGNDGKVFLVEADGSGREVFDADELNVHAIAATADGAYVGTSPDGAVYRVTDDGRSELVFDPEEQYIWALAAGPSGANGESLYVATGSPGRVYRITPDGTATLFYDTNTTHALAIAVGSEDSVLVSTGSPGQVFRVTPDGRGFVLLDSPYAEVRALRVAEDGTVYAVAVAGSPALTAPTSTTDSPPASGTPSVTVTTSTTVTAVVTQTASSAQNGTPPSASQPTSPRGSGAIYRIKTDGLWDIVWESSQDAPYDVALVPTNDPSGRALLIGTGGAGKIFRVLEDPTRIILLTRAPAQQVTRFIAAADGTQYYLTANPGKVYRLSAERVARGTYLSDVRDAGVVAAWGTISWQAAVPTGTTVRLATRTGNTKTPNDTWSPWSEPYTEPTGTHITSPKARYIQWRAELAASADSPELLSVTTAYLPRNLRPEVTEVVVHPPGIVFQQPFPGGDPPIAGLTDAAGARVANPQGTAGDSSQNTLGRQIYRKGLQAFAWTGLDGNRDALVYEVAYRAEDEPAWRVLSSELRRSIFTWDTTSVPDGTYVVRITVSDAVSNPPGLALVGSRESTPFHIDNSAPTLRVTATELRGDEVIVMLTATDTSSPIRRVEYSLDAEHWQVVHPVDGIPDSRTEQYEIVVAADDRAALVVRATDALGNTTTTAGL